MNGDGLLDIYVCYAGNIAGERRANELYINQGLDKNGVPTFKEEAAQYGLADEGMSTQAAFFDYDRDGYLDMYLVNNSARPVGSFGLRNIRNVRSKLGGHKLYHNDGNGHFTDVSEKAGIYGSEIAFGLGVGISDVNRDGWPDIYVSNDFFERDYLYINNHDGTFTEELPKEMPYSSYFSMGLDIADLNNDGWPDIYTTDMLPEDEYRLRTTSSFEGWDVYQAKVKNGYHYQFMRNMLQMNNGNGTFSDIGQMAGVARTDWSWSALIADLDLDGNKDIFVTNGVAKDETSQDFIAFLANDQTMASATRSGKVDFKALTNAMPSTKLPNYAFRNNGDLTFTNESAAWGLDTPSFSNGASYADLDGDGAIDLIVNNEDDTAFVYRNNARTLTKNHYLQVKLEGEGHNRFAVGAKVTLESGKKLFFQELSPTRGFQSSVDYVLTFGIGSIDTVPKMTVDWPDGRQTTLNHVAANQRLTIKQAGAQPATRIPAGAVASIFSDVTSTTRLDFVHHENDFVDFDRERLMPKMLSIEGPDMAVADVNGDGLDDIFIAGAKGQPSALLIQQKDGRFVRSNERLFAQDSASEDISGVFFDANGDGHPDLYVVTGGTEFSGDMAPALEDRLYINDGKGNFKKAVGALPPLYLSGSRAAAADYDGDGHIDLFVGGRSVPGRYGLDPQSVLLRNDGKGHFVDVTDQVAPGLSHVGMVTDAVWKDVDGDGKLDLVVVGDWMPITIFRNVGHGRLERMNATGAGEEQWLVEPHHRRGFYGERSSRLHRRKPGPQHETPGVSRRAGLDVRQGFRAQRIRAADRGVLQQRPPVSAGAARRSAPLAELSPGSLPQLQGLREADCRRRIPENGTRRRCHQKRLHVRDDAGQEQWGRIVHDDSPPARGAGRARVWHSGGGLRRRRKTRPAARRQFRRRETGARKDGRELRTLPARRRKGTLHSGAHGGERILRTRSVARHPARTHRERLQIRSQSKQRSAADLPFSRGEGEGTRSGVLGGGVSGAARR